MSYIKSYEQRNAINDYTHFGALKGIPKKSRNPETIKLKLIQKAIKMLLGKSDFATHDESDAVAIALCHVLMRGKNITGGSNNNNKKSGSRSMKASLAHKVNL